MKWTPLTAVLSLKVRPNNFALICRGWRREWPLLKQVSVSIGVIFIPRPEINVICHQVSNASWLEHTMHMSHCLVLNHTPLVMPGLWPWICEVQMQHIYNTVCAFVLNKLAGVVMKKPDIGQLIPASSIGCITKELSRPLDAKEVGVSLNGTLLHEECSLARANLELKRKFRRAK
jgi:hypothetical protein|tara:strand:- start:11 stop:535 length:525 start_codon:yes stop_codon:yes gene_type:complete